MIDQFNNEYRWLSNFYYSEIRFRGKGYATVEHAYQSAKSEEKAWKKVCSEGNEKPIKIKKLSKDLELPADWDTQKLGVMRECLELKFALEPFKTWLLETGDQHLAEGNSWGDIFWGVDLKTGEGENHLGRLLMEIRETLKT